MSNNNVAVITGGSKGIGKACVEDFLKEDYIVIDASRTETQNQNPNFHFIKTDVSNEDDVNNLFDFVKEKFGRLDVLINNAGFGRFAKLADSKTKDYDEMFAVNVKGLYLCTRYALNIMIPQNSGDIINIASIAGKNGVPTASIYCASKHAVMGFSKSLMLEVREHNIRVTVVCPGSVDTNFFDQPGSSMESDTDTILHSEDISAACLLAVRLPARALINEIELRPANPQKKSN